MNDISVKLVDTAKEQVKCEPGPEDIHDERDPLAIDDSDGFKDDLDVIKNEKEEKHVDLNCDQNDTKDEKCLENIDSFKLKIEQIKGDNLNIFVV